MKSGMFFVTDLVGMQISLKYLRIELNVACYMCSRVLVHVVNEGYILFILILLQTETSSLHLSNIT